MNCKIYLIQSILFKILMIILKNRKFSIWIWNINLKFQKLFKIILEIEFNKKNLLNNQETHIEISFFFFLFK